MWWRIPHGLIRKEKHVQPTQHRFYNYTPVYSLSSRMLITWCRVANAGEERFWALIQLLLRIFGSMFYDVPHRYFCHVCIAKWINSNTLVTTTVQHIDSCTLHIKFARSKIPKVASLAVLWQRRCRRRPIPGPSLAGTASMAAGVRSGSTSLPIAQRESSNPHHMNFL